MGLRQVDQCFSSFFAKFLAYLMIFQSGEHAEGAAKLRKIIKYVKKLKKSLVQFTLKTNFSADSWYVLENRFRISDSSLKTTSMVIYNKRQQQQKPRVWYEKSRAQVVIKLGPLEMSF